MSPNTAINMDNHILRDDNYFYWEFNAIMMLARKNLLGHIDGSKPPPANDAAALLEWKASDMKAFAILATMLSQQYQTMIRTARTANHVREILQQFFVKNSLHNRVSLRRRLHEFKMDKGDNLMDHFMRFDELVMSMGATGDPMTEDEMLVVLLGSLSEEFNNIVRIIENIESITIMSAKQIPQREWESQEKKDVNEVALRATRFQYSKNRNDTAQSNNNTFSGRCHYCNRKGHKERETVADKDSTEKAI